MTTWNIDQAHSEIGFTVRHLMVTRVRGKFNAFEGKVEASDDTFENAQVSFSADIASIDTNNAQRDGHLQSADFFEAEKFPKLTFASKSFVGQGEGKFVVTGDLSMHGVTQEVALDAHFDGLSVGMAGEPVAAFGMTGSLSRKEFGLLWNVALETGGVAVSDEVKLDMAVELKKMVA